MIDIHTHIINEIDDGARSLEESLNVIRNLSKIGITDIIATPHYIVGSSYISNNSLKKYKLENLEYYVKKEKIPVNLYLGNEIFIDTDILEFLKRKEVTTLNNSKYLLVEFPVSRAMNEMMDILFYLRSKDYIPIIAHPERYLYLQENPGLIDNFLKMGCLFQGNFSNIVKKYGTHAKKLFIYMLKNNKYQFLATDIHHDGDILFTNMSSMEHKIIKIIGQEKYHELTYLNPLKVLKNENIKLPIDEY